MQWIMNKLNIIKEIWIKTSKSDAMTKRDKSIDYSYAQSFDL